VVLYVADATPLPAAAGPVDPVAAGPVDPRTISGLSINV
jgi:hypothetical protein